MLNIEYSKEYVHRYVTVLVTGWHTGGYPEGLRT